MAVVRATQGFVGSPDVASQSYFQVAARLGDCEAQQELGYCLANGKGCKKNLKEAAKWYRAAVSPASSAPCVLDCILILRLSWHAGCPGREHSGAGMDIQVQVYITQVVAQLLTFILLAVHTARLINNSNTLIPSIALTFPVASHLIISCSLKLFQRCTLNTM